MIGHDSNVLTRGFSILKTVLISFILYIREIMTKVTRKVNNVSETNSRYSTPFMLQMALNPQNKNALL